MQLPWAKKPVPEPKKQRNWLRSRVSAAMVRLFNSAKTETFWSSWSKSASTIDQAVHQDWATLVARSRDQYANNDYVKRFVNLSQVNISGERGISVQSTVQDRNRQPDVAIQRTLEEAWNDFSRKVTADGLSRAEFEALIIQGCAIDGEVFVQIHINKAFKYGVMFSFIDPILCPVQYHDVDNNIRHGIQYDAMGAPKAYFFSDAPVKHNPHISYTSHAYDNLKKIPAGQIWHVFKREWVGQKRGIPWTATSLGRLKDLAGYEEAAIINARVGASKMGFFETTGNGEYVGDEDSLGNVIMEAEPASFEVLPEGLKLSSWNPDYPHQQFGEFITANLRGISVGLGVSHHSLTGDMTGVNYTSSRTALLDERENWKRKQEWLIHHVTRPMYETFIQYGMDMGKITINGNPLREQPEFYFPATFQGKRWQWVDPAKEVSAIKESVALRTKSLSDAIREMGKDPETVWNEIARENELLEKLGIMIQTTEQPDNSEAEDADN